MHMGGRGLSGFARPRRLKAQTLKTVQDRGPVRCGINEGLSGFRSRTTRASGLASTPTSAARSPPPCSATRARCISAAVRERAFQGAATTRTSTAVAQLDWTLGRETSCRRAFTGVDYYDGQGFLVAKSRKLQSALELDGAKVCVRPARPTRRTSTDYFETNHMAQSSVPPRVTSDCRLQRRQMRRHTTDPSQSLRVPPRSDKARRQVILLDVISKEPLSAGRAPDDMQWCISSDGSFVMIDAESSA